MGKFHRFRRDMSVFRYLSIILMTFLYQDITSICHPLIQPTPNPKAKARVTSSTRSLLTRPQKATLCVPTVPTHTAPERYHQHHWCVYTRHQLLMLCLRFFVFFFLRSTVHTHTPRPLWRFFCHQRLLLLLPVWKSMTHPNDYTCAASSTSPCPPPAACHSLLSSFSSSLATFCC